MLSAPGSVVDDSLQQLCRQLVALRLVVDISVASVCGEPDVRLRVCRRESPDVTIELLVPDPATWSSWTWDAARIRPGCRRMWRGPEQGCPVPDVAAFVRALLCDDSPDLTDHYVELG